MPDEKKSLVVKLREATVQEANKVLFQVQGTYDQDSGAMRLMPTSVVVLAGAPLLDPESLDKIKSILHRRNIKTKG